MGRRSNYTAMLNRLFRPKPKPATDAPTGGRVYAIGDVHGRLDLLRALYVLIAQDAADTPTTVQELVISGEIVYRAEPDSIQFEVWLPC